MDSILIRPAGVGDLDGLLALFRELADGTEVRMPDDAGRSRPVLNAMLADSARHLYVADTGGTLVGTAELLVVPNLTSHARPWGVIENVVVSASARRQGVATALCRQLIEIATAAGCYKVGLTSGKQRTAAHALYAKLGFRAVSEGFKIYLDGR